MLKRGQSTAAPEPPEVIVTEEDPNLPISSDKLRLFLIAAFATNYKDKFGEKHIPAKNVFSVSNLVQGPGSSVYKYKETLKNTDAKGEEAKVFSYDMFRGSAIHEYANTKLEKFYSYEKIAVREQFGYQWKDPNFTTIIMQGHPDLVHYGRLTVGDVVFCDDPNASVLMEIKTIGSNAEEKELAAYKAGVLKKAKRQAGCYAAMLSNELKRKHYAYVVIMDDRPNQLFLTDEDKAARFKLINAGKTRLELDDRMIKRGVVYDSSLRVYPMSQDEIWQGYNYCKWAAMEAARRIEDEEQK